MRTVGLAAVTAAGALALAGCGGGGGSSSSSGSGSSSASSTSGAQNTRAQFDACLKQHGVTPPNPGAGAPQQGQGPPGGASSGAFRQALQACAKYRPQGGGPGGGGGYGGAGGGGGGFNPQALAAYRTCMQQHGVTLQQGARPDQTDPKVQSAMQACRSQLPQRNGAPPAGGQTAPPTGTTSGTSS